MLNNEHQYLKTFCIANAKKYTVLNNLNTQANVVHKPKHHVSTTKFYENRG